MAKWSKSLKAKIKARRKKLKRKIKKMERKDGNLLYLRGALEDVDWMRRLWSNKSGKGKGSS